MPADALFVLIGARPHTAWLPPQVARDAHGFVVAGAELAHDGLLDDWLLPRSPRTFETSVPGVFAVGDVRSRSMKRVASSVGEGSGSIKEIHHYLESDKRGQRCVGARRERPKPGRQRHGMGHQVRLRDGDPGRTDDEIVENAQDHAKSKHSLTVTREQALALAERE